MRVFSTLFIFILLLSCTSNKIFVKRISDLIEINAGDSAWVYWDFQNAKYVKVSGYEQIFSPSDSILVKPRNPLRLDVVAFGEENAQLLQSVYILVNPTFDNKSEQKQTVQRGPKVIENIFEEKNSTISKFFLGFTTGSISNVNYLRIFRVKPSKFRDSIEVSFGLLDRFGNLLYDVSKFPTDLKVELEQKCPNKISSTLTQRFPTELTIEKKLNFFVLVDYSIINENPKLKQQIQRAVRFLEVSDKVALYLFGVKVDNVIPLEMADKFGWDLETFEFPKRIELSSIYRSLWNLINEIEENSKSVIVLITNKMDNSSINYTLEDIIDLALKKGISINTIAYGNEVSPSTYYYISSKTGGTSVHFPWQVDDIAFGLTEIILSNKYYFKSNFPIERKAFECNDLNLKLFVRSGQLAFSDSYLLPIKDRNFYTNYQAVSLFKFADTTLSENFLPCIDNLANLMVNHRNLVVELIGTAGIGEQYSDPIKLSLERALAVKNRLIERGVFPSQIRTKGIGISKPLFPVEDDEFSGLFNRRVEIRWLIPEVLPFTIVVDTTLSEDLAEKKVLFWEKQGFRAYYDRFLSNSGIMYKVVLWGYSKYEEAEKDAKKIFKKYRKSTFVE
ncbi:MAG: OmpA family protein [Ignavibacteria bacterium]|nr:OmpA family protein [Ignavibacteria bacterium]